MAYLQSKFQVKANFFSTQEQCKEAEKKKENTNPRYKHFCQTHFTAGDVDQFETFKDSTNGENKTVLLPEKNLFDNVSLPDFKKYEELTAVSVYNTFSYLFHKFKKGIFIKIKNNKLSVFLPFSKKNYTNEWYKRITIPENFFENLEKNYKENTSLYFSTKSINKFKDCWYANNFLLRYEFPVHEGDTNNPIFADFFETLCKERELPDIEFFLNRRDMPLLKKNETEPYNHIFDSKNQPLLSHNYSEYSPILSMVSSEEFADIAIPTGDDWSRVCREENKYFIDTYTRSFEIENDENLPWESRIPTAFFRGSSTGEGVTVETNPRLKAAYLSTLKKEDNGIPLLDVGITEWNLRARKLSCNSCLQTIDIKSLPFSLVPRVSPKDQLKYKYILNIPGHTAAYRLSLEMFFGSCILLVESEFKLWFLQYLKPFVHYVPVKNNLEDLFEKILWCKNNDEKAKEIAINAKKFAKKYLTKDGILDYMQALLISLKEKTGTYVYNKSFLELQKNQEKKLLSKVKVPIKEKIQLTPGINSFFIIERKYYFLHAVEWIIFNLIKNSSFDTFTRNTIYKNKNSLIESASLLGYTFAIKSYTETEKDAIHEAFVSLQCINKLLEKIPNFVYVFGYKENELYLEYIEGETFYSFINSNTFTIENYIFILIQIFLALQVAQNYCGFVHNDLTPWNIILQKHETPIEVNYVIGENVYSIMTDMVPIIVDLNRSHIIYENIHYGKINMFSSSSIQDVITLLLSSLFEVTKKEKYAKELIILGNFISGTKYKPSPFLMTGNAGLGDLRFFLSKAKKYETLLDNEKFELERKRPIDFVNYIREKFNYKFPMKIQKIYEKKINFSEGSSKQVLNYVLAKTDEEKLASFTDFFHNINKRKVIKQNNVLMAFYSLQKHYAMMNTVREHLRYYNAEYKVSWFSHVKKTLVPLTKNKPEEIDYKDFLSYLTKISHIDNIEYNEKTFFDKKKVSELLEKVKSVKIIDDSIYREIVSFSFLFEGKYELPADILSFYKNNFSKLLSTDEYKIKVFNANVKTLKIYSKA